MPTVQIDGVGTVQLDNSFNAKSPADQQAVIEGIASQHAANTAPAAPSTAVDMLRSIPGGLAQGAAAVVGLPGDVANLAARGAHYLAAKAGIPDYKIPGTQDVPFPGSATANAVLSAPTGGYYQPKTVAGQYTQTVASMAPAAFGGEASLLGRAGRVLIPGLTSETAGQLTAGTPAEPWARAGGALLGGAIDTSLPRLPGVLPTLENAQRTAGTQIANSATDLSSLPQKLDAATEIVTGSKPTTFQATGDPGLGALESQVRANPVGKAVFAQRAADQNTARLDQMDAIQPSGDPSDLTGYLQGKMQAIDADATGKIADATSDAQQAAQGLGGNLSAADYGAQLRDPLQTANDAAKANERSLWQAVDPDGTLTVNGAPISQAAQDIQDTITPSARQPSKDEQDILAAASSYGKSVPFRDVGDLRSNVSLAMRQELRTNGQTPAYARLARLRGSIEDAITGAAEGSNQAAQDAVKASGVTPVPEDSLAARLQAWTREFMGKRAAQAQASPADNWAQEFYGNKAAQSGAGPSASFGSVPAAGPRYGFGGDGTGFSQSGGSGGLAGNQSLPSQPFDPAAVERLGLATQATKARASTFNLPPLAPMLKTSGMQGQYRLSDSSVPAQIFKPGAKAFESVTAYRNAVGDPHAMEVLQDYAASSLRKTAARPDGTLDPSKTTSWINRHSDALRAMPGLQVRFQGAASASNAIAEAAANRKAILDQYQTGALGKITGLSPSDDVSRVVGGMLNSPTGATQMRQLATAASKDPQAAMGLRKAVVDYMRQRLTTPGADGAAIRAKPFQAFVNQNRGSLRAVLSDQQINSINAIADDLQRSSRTPGPSAVVDTRPSILRRVMTEGAGMLAGGAISHAPLVGPAIGWLGVKAVNAMRDAGISRVDDLLREAMLHPEVAKALLAKVPARTPPNFGSALATSLARSSVLSAVPQLATASAGIGGQYPAMNDFSQLPRLPVQNAAGAP